MYYIRRLKFLLLFCPFILHAQTTNTELAVWVNEAIVATYSYDYQNFLGQQRSIAHYFSNTAWQDYSAAINAAHLPEMVQKNSYFVSAVAQMPPTIVSKSPTSWQATMPVLVLYKNPQYQQKQILNVTINFSTAQSGQGVRGLFINSLQAKTSEDPCVCAASSTTNNNQ